MTPKLDTNDWSATWTLYRGFYRYARGLQRPLTNALLCVVGIAVTNTLLIWQLSQPLNDLQQENFGALPHSLLMLALLIIVNQGFHAGAIAITAWMEGRITGRLRRALIARCLNVSFPVVDGYARGDILARLSDEAERLTHFLTFSVLVLISQILVCAFYAVMLVWIDARLAALALLFAPVFALHQWFFGRRKERIANRMFRNHAALLSLETDVLNALKGMSSFQAESIVRRKHRLVDDTYRRTIIRNKWLDAWVDGSVTALIYLGGLATIAIGITHVRDGSLSVGELVSFLFYLGYLSIPIRGFSSFVIDAREIAPTARRARQLLALELPVDTRGGTAILNNVGGRIEFRGVSFAFDARKPIFDDVSLVLAPGETVALVGASGTGKTTLFKLLLRFYDPQAGSIYIDGHDIRSVTLVSLRAAMAVVWQEPFLLNDTLRSNLQLARPDASDAQIIDACVAAHAWEFVQALPQQLDTVIHAGGTEFSTGQLQRLSLAQAFLRDAPILLLDDPSSGLDSRSEMAITDALGRLRKHRTTLIIAHRYSTIRSADRVLFFDGDGALTSGKHNELWVSHAEYRHAVEWQTALQHDAARLSG